jgi:hypothetical protein
MEHEMRKYINTFKQKLTESENLNISDVRSSKKTNEGWFSKKQKDSQLEEINLKISDAAYSLKTFGTLTKQGAFINGAKWAIQNLTEEEIKYLRENGDKDDFSFFGIG